MNTLKIAFYRPKYAYKINPLYTYENATRWHRYISESCQLNAEQSAQIRNTGLTSALFYPFCNDLDRFEILVKIVIGFYMFDDISEGDLANIQNNLEMRIIIWTEMCQIIDKLAANEMMSTNEMKPNILTMYNLLESLLNGCNKIQKIRAHRIWRDYFQSNLDEIYINANNIELNDLDQYMTLRKNTSGMMGMFQMVEFANNIYITDEEWNSHEFQTMITLVCKYAAYINDVYSYEKELKECNGCNDKMLNYVALLSKIEKISIYEAMERALKMAEEIENDLIEILKIDQDTSADMKIFKKNMEYILGPCYKFCTEVDRYKSNIIVNIDPETSFKLNGIF